MTSPGRALRTRFSGRKSKILLRLLQSATVLLIGGVVLSVAAFGILLFWYFTRSTTPEEPIVASEVEIPVGTRSVTLYFAAENADSLVAENRQLLETESVSKHVQALVHELVVGPDGSRLRPLFPTGTRVQRVFFDEEGQVFIDFTPEIQTEFRGGSTAEYLLLASLVRTLSANLPTVRAVTLTVSGRPIETLAGHFATYGRLHVSEWL